MKPPVEFTTGKDSRYDFTVDLVRGEIAERAAAMILVTESVEVKTKRRDDSFYYVEYEQNPYGRGDWFPSGIKTTKATHWVFIYCENEVALTVTVDVLKEAGRAAYADHENRREIGGDNPTRGILVSLDQILAVAYRRRIY
jgi:hypothetical protein